METKKDYKPTPPAPKTTHLLKGNKGTLNSSLRAPRRSRAPPPRALTPGERNPSGPQRGFYSEVLAGDPARPKRGEDLKNTARLGVGAEKVQRDPAARSFIRPSVDVPPPAGATVNGHAASPGSQPATPVKGVNGDVVASPTAVGSPQARESEAVIGGRRLPGVPLQAVEPKVMTPYLPGPGKTPRKVEIERKKRLFAAQDLEELLKHEGIDYSIPQHIKDRDTPFPTYLPLEAFDDTEYESRSPEQWVGLGMVDGEMKSVPAKALRFNEADEGRWKHCRMVGYDVKQKKFQVEWEDIPDVAWVSRINIMFLAEDPFRFARRVASAHAGRKEAEALLRYNLYVDSMPTDEIPPLDSTQVKRVLSSALNVKRLKGKRLDTSMLVKEINKDYARTMNKIIFDMNYKDPNQADLFDSLALPPLPEDEDVPEFGTVRIPDHNFPEQFSEFTFHSFLTKPEVINAIVKVRGECNRIQSLNLFNTFFTKSVRMDEFEQMQFQANQQVVNNLKESWVTTLKNAIKNSLRAVGKGWFNLHERNKEVYDISKLKKFMVMINFMMQDSLRFLVESNLEAYAQFIENAALGKTIVNSPSDVKQEFESDQVRYTARKNPLFLVDLLVKDNEFVFSTPVSVCEETPLQIFDKVLTSLQDIPQLEPQVMEDLFWAHKPMLAAVHRGEDDVEVVRTRIQEALLSCLRPLQEYMAIFDEYVEFAKLDPQEYVKQFEDGKLTVVQLKKEVNEHLSERRRIETSIPVSIAIGMFTVNCLQLRNFLADKRAQMAKLVLEALAKRARAVSDKIHGEYQKVFIELQKRPDCIEELVTLREYMAKIPAETADCAGWIKEMSVYYDVLEDFKFPLVPEDFNQKWVSYGWPRKISERIEEVDRLLEHDKSRFQTDLIRDKETFFIELEEFQRVISGFSRHTNLAKVATVAEEVARLQSQLNNAAAKAKKYNSRDVLFGFEVTEFEDLEKVQKMFEPYANLWSTANNWLQWHKSWMNDSFHTLDYEKMDNDLSTAWKVMYKAVKFFQDKGSGQYEIACELKQQMDDFKPHMPMVTALRNPGMRDRHWIKIREETSLDLAPTDDQTLETLLKLDLAPHMEDISKVAQVAGKEFAIEEALDKMEGEWGDISFEILEYRTTGTYVVKGSDDIIQLLDDHIAMTQSMSFSAFKKPFEERIAKWETKLTLISDIIDEWLACQRNWLYLEPIFSSDDINRQMPTEGKRFSTVDRMWRKVMGNAAKNPQVMAVTSIDKVLDTFQECNKLLDLIHKGLTDYLETKRTAFPRFYFLSNDELLEILSQTKDPKAVQPHLRKCFEAIASIHFEEDLKMSSMTSMEKETVDFCEPLYPKGNVENWLLEVERVMRKSLRLILKEATSVYKKTKRTEWVTNWPGQIVIAGSQVHWTQEVETALRKAGCAGLERLFKKLCGQLDDLTGLIRSGKLSRLDRKTLGSLIVIDVHARDVVDRMVQSGVNDIREFEWISQLRYYMEGDQVTVKMVNTNFNYGYEYLGNTGRLVITPLTDRCYITLTGALHVQLGGAPAGPAGTGKTETTKDLAKALAKQCVVFNCSDGLDYLAMGKFFKGLASAGAWACFDEFNRIDLEVLSVIAQQIISIQKAIQQKVKRFMFEGVEIALDPTCSVFITMNPGYAGRTELPDNLKALFRPMAMMVPDYALIAEIMLYSYGFSSALGLARKMVATFRLSSEQLSSQDHYDFGMRAVKTVISAAGNLKAKTPDMDEQLLLLRALKDCNLPKFLADDIPLFNGIISDLFPGVKEQSPDYGNLLTAIESTSKSLGLQPVEPFMMKVIQLYDTLVIRHGVMLVGPTGGGKTSCYKVLSGAMTALKDDPLYDQVNYNVINPKSITMGQLYGEFDPNTHEWTDGVLAAMIRQGAGSTDTTKNWMIFDGPVDALWIENMNTVLDDNKKLCLSSGEIIKLAETQSMLFEVEDLAVASPATVSRCGMVYMEPGPIGSAPLVNSWLDALSKNCQPYREKLEALFEAFLDSSLQFLRKNLKEAVGTVDNNLVQSLCRVLNCFFARYSEDEGNVISAEQLLGLESLMEPLFLFSLVWSVGATCDAEGQLKFDQFLRGEIARFGCATEFPEEGTVYDYLYDQEKREWVKWMDTVPEYTVDPKAEFSTVIVPTIQSVRSTFMLDLLCLRGYQVLCVGPTGTGKSVNITGKLNSGLPSEYTSLSITFSARTSANQTQDILDSKMDRRRKGIFGPPAGKKYVVFVDDVNMPQKEEYGAQPPIELIRQFLDFGGWYDRKLLTLRKIIDTQIVGAMGPPGGGRNHITPRILRHFNILSFPTMGEDSLRHIYRTIIGAHLSSAANGFAEDVQGLCNSIVEASLSVYNTILRDLLPTPAKTHYTFNMRDLGKVFQGVLLAKMFHPSTAMETKKNLTRLEMITLWSHETTRVFCDRLVDEEDRKWFYNLLTEQFKNHFALSDNEIPQIDELVYGDFMIANAFPRLYDQITNTKKLTSVINEYLEDYNANSNKPMKLVMFKDAISHVSRISRIIRQPKGNALLLGVGGSGRQSLTRLAAFMAEYKLKQVEISKGYGVEQWHDDLKDLMFPAGLENQSVVFLFTDTQITLPNMLEDINNILNSGEVPNLFNAEDMDNILNTMRPEAQKLGIQVTKSNLFALFVQRCRANIHCVLCMSPVGEEFRSYLRMFPSLVNCCTIDWFSKWPMEALKSVAEDLLEDVELGSDKIKASVVKLCTVMHEQVAVKSVQYREEQRRFNYVTPTSYLELLNVFTNLLAEKRTEVGNLTKRLEIGLDKLESTGKEVAVMQKELISLEPVLLQTTKEVDDMMVIIVRDKKSADITKADVVREKAAAATKTEETKAIAEDAQRDLDEALPALDAAVASLKSLNKADITEVRSMQRPPHGVKLVMEAVCIMKGVKPDKVPGERPGEKVNDYWGPAKNMTNDNKFLDSLFAYDKDNIPDAIIDKITPYINDPNFTPTAVAKVSKACTSLCLWVRAMEKYYHVAKAVAPKRARLQVAQEALEETLARLNDAKKRLQDVEDSIRELERKYEETLAKKDEYQRKVVECQTKLDRAQKLIGGLGGEKDRWTMTVADLRNDFMMLVGNVLLSSGTVAYLGAFTGEYRESLTKMWAQKLQELEIPHSPGTSMHTTLGNPVKIQGWHIAGLPKDNLSIENGIILDKARRWPLMIDPQGQANKWVKAMERDNGLDVIRTSERDFLRTLENGVRFGKPVLLENVGEELDPAMEPLLLQQTFKQGGTEVIRLGDSVIPYHPDFRFYITTKLPNPHYRPESQVKVTLLNFNITFSGLEDQLLGQLVARERPDLEDQKNQLVISNAQMRRELKELEDKILELLSTSQGNILEDETLIEVLSASKTTSEEIHVKVAEAEKTEKQIDATRSLYRPVAFHASILFFCVVDLANIDPMYQNSLTWFINLFVQGIAKAPPSNELEERLKHLNDFFTEILYNNICRALFEKHKLLFSFLLCVRIMQGQEKIDPAEWRFLIAGSASEVDKPNPAAEWLTDNAWTEIVNMSRLPTFKGFDDSLVKNPDAFKAYFDVQETQDEPIPCGWDTKLDAFQRILVLRCLRPDKVVPGVQKLVLKEMGQHYIEAPEFNLANVFEDSAPGTPLIFILSTGSDPAAELFKFAEEMRFSKKLQSISLGQGQGPRAEALMREAIERGTWVLLQNCHLAVSWMPALEKFCENIHPEKVHRDFRLWLTSMPSDKFPISILQNGVKMTNEPPAGLRANLLQSYAGFDDTFLNNSCEKPERWKKLLYGLCFFHGVILERRKFGALGWNIPYEFTWGDLSISQKQLRMFLDEYEEIPFKVLNFTAGSINYGGRVTDDQDRRLILTLLKDYYQPTALDDGHTFVSHLKTYVNPPPADVKSYRDYLKSLPIIENPEIFGLHPNADITCATNTTMQMFENIVTLQPRSGGGGGLTREEVITNLASDILAKVPVEFNVEEVAEKHPISYSESMTTVLIQEITRYNGVVSVVRRSLSDVLKALKGLVVMSTALEHLTDQLFNNQVPDMWAAKAYPSLKPLSSWVTDLLERLAFLKAWIKTGIPTVFWISGFFFPQAFLTGTLQNFARKYVVSVDTLSFDFTVIDKPYQQIKEKPKDGCFIRGLYLEGARWDSKNGRLAESRPKELFTELPVVWLCPVADRKRPEEGIYVCPVYKTLKRAGTLSTTGHSTNFVLMIEVPSDKEQSHWIKRGVAAICALNY